MDGIGLDWKSLKALILRAPLCGANKNEGLSQVSKINFKILKNWNFEKDLRQQIIRDLKGVRKVGMAMQALLPKAQLLKVSLKLRSQSKYCYGSLCW